MVGLLSQADISRHPAKTVLALGCSVLSILGDPWPIGRMDEHGSLLAFGLGAQEPRARRNPNRNETQLALILERKLTTNTLTRELQVTLRFPHVPT